MNNRNSVIGEISSGRLKVLSVEVVEKRFGDKVKKVNYWLCKCECGREQIYEPYKIRGKKVLECQECAMARKMAKNQNAKKKI